jgi:hypothetical protein
MCSLPVDRSARPITENSESLRDAEVLDRRARARATKVKLESRLNCNIKVHDLMFGAAT